MVQHATINENEELNNSFIVIWVHKPTVCVMYDPM